MKLAYIVGHTIDDQGARGARPISQQEYQWNFDFSALAYMEARHLGLDCRVFFRKDGQSKRDFAKKVNSWGDCAIELHFNAFNGTVAGTETLYDPDPEDSKKLAEIIHGNIIECFERTGERDRGLKLIDDRGDRGWVNLDSVTIPSCLVEPVFGDNIQEAELLDNKRTAYAKALSEGAYEFLYKKGY